MRKDTQLVIVDVPGVNEANASKKYWDFVESHWATFDCVVIVMDGRQGVNTECQVSLLQFVKANLKAKKDIPVVILFNKVDDPDDEEQVELVFEAQREVEKLFGVSDRQESLESLLHDRESQKSPNVQIDSVTSDEESNQEPSSICPVFIPVSAIGAFIFQTCSNMTLEKFQEFDAQLISKLGREYVDKRKWRKLSSEERIHVAYEAVSDPEGYKDGLEDSNFHKFLNVLKVLIGGETVQTKLIQDQIHLSLNNVSWGTGLVERLEVIHKEITAAFATDALESSSSHVLLKETFWRLCKDREGTLSRTSSLDDITASAMLLDLADELINYKKFAVSLCWEAEAKTAVEFVERCVVLWLESRGRVHRLFTSDLKKVYSKIQEMSADTSLNPHLKSCFLPLYEKLERDNLEKFKSTGILHHISTLADRLTEYGKFAIEVGWEDQTAATYEKFQGLVRKQIDILCEGASKSLQFKNSHTDTFGNISFAGWSGILRSILLLRYSERFCMDFGSEIVRMEYLADRNITLALLFDKDVRSGTGMQFSKLNNKRLARIGDHQRDVNVPSSISDSKHFGNVAWRYLQFENERVKNIVSV